MLELPTGIVAFVMTDIAGSTRLLAERPAEYPAVLQRHREILGEAFARHDGIQVDATGDAMFFVLSNVAAVLEAAAAAQRALQAERWPGHARVRVRMGIHAGTATVGVGGYVGVDVHLAARVMAAGHGGQVLCTDTVHALCEGALPRGSMLRDRGRYRLKDIDRPVRLWDLVAPGLETDFPPLKGVERRASLPVRLSSLIGRDDAKERVVEALTTHRLVTLTGPGGTGKTRLGIAVAASIEDRFADGAAFIDLSSITDSVLVASSMASALEIGVPGDKPVEAALVTHLADRDLLLVIDNFEQVLPAAGLLSSILKAAPSVKLLVTSRAPLRIEGEREWPVPPLAVPGPDAASEAVSPAVLLFIERARAVVPGLVVGDEAMASIASICRRLDGIPLAIELAAPRLRMMTPEVLDRRLPSSLDLSSASLDTPERQRTLRRTIAWSVELLDENLVRQFRRLACFRGGWTLEAAEAVLDGMPGGRNVEPDLEALIANSLVQVSPGTARMTMLETIREYADELLAAGGEEPELRALHATYFRALAEEAAPRLLGAGRDAVAEHLRAELDNFRAAIGHARDSGHPDTALAIASSLLTVWHLNNLFAEPRALLERILASDGSAVHPAVAAEAHATAGELALYQSDFGAALSHAMQALDLYRAIGDAAGAAHQLCNIGWGTMTRDDAAALGQFREALALARSAGDLHSVGNALTGSAVALYRQQHDEQVVPTALEGIAAFEQIGERYVQVFAHVIIGLVHARHRRVADAASVYATAVRMAHRAGGADAISSAVDASALLLLHDNPVLATRLGAAMEAFREAAGGVTTINMAGETLPLDRTKASLHPTTYERSREEGLALTLDDVISEALDALRRIGTGATIAESAATPSAM
jgi:predicted ATPase/class 3 adenylate cyclase